MGDGKSKGTGRNENKVKWTTWNIKGMTGRSGSPGGREGKERNERGEGKKGSIREEGGEAMDGEGRRSKENQGVEKRRGIEEQML